MTKVAGTDSRNTTQWDVIEWAVKQGEHMPSANHQSMLFYLCANAFYTDSNPEDGYVGQVMWVPSYVQHIMVGTGIKSRETVRKALNDLQTQGFIMRRERAGASLRDPHEIHVLWVPEMDDLRARVRAGEAALPPIFQVVPQPRPGRSHPRPKLSIVTAN